MATATFKLRGLSVPSIIEVVRSVNDKLAANVAVYATPVPSVATLTTAVDTLDDAYRLAINGGTDKKAQMRLSLNNMLTLMTTLQGYVQATSGGDAAKILLVADVKKERKPVGILSPPTNVRSTYGYSEGEIIFRWNGVRQRTSYHVQINSTPNNDQTWQTYAYVGKTRIVVSGLVSGSPCALRIATLSSAGMGGWSDVAMQKAR